jgi:hypothetical protein
MTPPGPVYECSVGVAFPATNPSSVTVSTTGSSVCVDQRAEVLHTMQMSVACFFDPLGPIHCF